MTEAEFKRISDYVYRHWGIDLTGKKLIVAGKLENHMRLNGYESYNEYMDDLQKDISGKKAKEFVNIITTNHTYFMREFDQMEYFRDVVLPDITKITKNTHDLRIWSAAASSGEEPYTIAMVIKDYLGLNYNGWDATVLATDISQKVLKIAAQGIYYTEQIKGIPETWKRAYFKKIDEDTYEISRDIKNAVVFREFNLMNPLPFKHKLHVVFLRNVMIYFDAETKRLLIDRIYNYMEPGGYLFIGGTEAIDKEKTGFQYIKPSIFRK